MPDSRGQRDGEIELETGWQANEDGEDKETSHVNLTETQTQNVSEHCEKYMEAQSDSRNPGRFITIRQ